MSFSIACDLDAVVNALEGDRDLLLRMIQVFLEESPMLLSKTRNALVERDAVAVARAAHTLRGALANFGARDAGLAARQIEVSAGQGDWENADATHSQLEKQMEAVVRELTAFGAGAQQ